MADYSQTVCLNHPDTPAVTRCAACAKPICPKCVVLRNDSRFCSAQCADNADKAYDRVNTVVESKKRADGRSFTRLIAILLIIAGIAGGIYYYYKSNPSKANKIIKKAELEMKKVEKKIERSSSEAKADIQKNVPGDSKYKKDRENMVK